MGDIYSKGTFEPDELGALQQIFTEVTSQPWFDQTDETKVEFAKYLFETFPAVSFDARKHRSIIEASARMFYSREAS
ncbi:hypothetical protein [Shinella zoogloeoides]|uniref:hypothetical protein n=1 Tax=Shinella zoogloeoides TaxID=352475 RepID=UPI00299F3CB2|nr:hypothetical protein [Shinella zoogloeoides]WPE23895.1 hypothetical protein ShzoTeo12_51150 [Shinella zoogloeoides]